jgi:hypothetical protein
MSISSTPIDKCPASASVRLPCRRRRHQFDLIDGRSDATESIKATSELRNCLSTHRDGSVRADVLHECAQDHTTNSKAGSSSYDFIEENDRSLKSTLKMCDAQIAQRCDLDWFDLIRQGLASVCGSLFCPNTLSSEAMSGGGAR